MSVRMVVRVFLASTAVAALLLSIGCTSDKLGVMSHPKAAKPGSTINVVLCDVVQYVANDSTGIFVGAVRRDSLYAAVNLPTGYSVASMSCYAASHVKVAKFATSEDSFHLVKRFFKDSIAAYRLRAVAMVPDQKLPLRLKKKYYSGYDGFDSSAMSITVATDSLKGLTGFKGKIGILWADGTPCDTVFRDKSSIIDTNKHGVSARAVFIFASVNVRAAAGTDTLYYFAKSDTVQAPAATDTVATSVSGDYGSFTYVRFTADPNARVILERDMQRPRFDIIARPGRILIEHMSAAIRTIDIFDARGVRVRTLTKGNAASVLWDGTDNAGVSLTAGSYIIRTPEQSRTILLYR